MLDLILAESSAFEDTVKPLWSIWFIDLQCMYDQAHMHFC
jgi:hypothetical protein